MISKNIWKRISDSHFSIKYFFQLCFLLKDFTLVARLFQPLQALTKVWNIKGYISKLIDGGWLLKRAIFILIFLPTRNIAFLLLAHIVSDYLCGQSRLYFIWIHTSHAIEYLSFWNPGCCINPVQTHLFYLYNQYLFIYFLGKYWDWSLFMRIIATSAVWWVYYSNPPYFNPMVLGELL